MEIEKINKVNCCGVIYWTIDKDFICPECNDKNK